MTYFNRLIHALVCCLVFSYAGIATAQQVSVPPNPNAVNSFSYQRQLGDKLNQEPGVHVIQVGSNLKVVLSVDSFFQPQSATRLIPDRIPAMQQVAQLIASYGDRLITVTGHTDNVGTPRAKFSLTKQQANTIAAYLWSNGIPLRNVMVMGAGDVEPVASNHTLAGSAMNRRIEITI